MMEVKFWNISIIAMHSLRIEKS